MRVGNIHTHSRNTRTSEQARYRFFSLDLRTSKEIGLSVFRVSFNLLWGKFSCSTSRKSCWLWQRSSLSVWSYLRPWRAEAVARAVVREVAVLADLAAAREAARVVRLAAVVQAPRPAAAVQRAVPVPAVESHQAVAQTAGETPAQMATVEAVALTMGLTLAAVPGAPTMPRVMFAVPMMRRARLARAGGRTTQRRATVICKLQWWRMV